MGRRFHQLSILLGLVHCINIMTIFGLASASHERKPHDSLRGITPKATITPSPATTRIDEQLLPSSFFPNDEAATPKYDLSNLMEFCPRADICAGDWGHKPKNTKDSCCLPCKCDSICKKMGNCCDKRGASGDMCHLPYVEQGVDLHKQQGYFMVSRCLNDSSSETCMSAEAAPWGSLYPVYDQSTDLSYYNAYCAECNGAQSYTYWDLNLEPSSADWSLTHCLRHLSGIKHKDCAIGFTPPKEMDLMNHVCSHDLVSSCNVTGLWIVYDAELEKACHRWFSPVLDIYGRLHYANIYCGLCNGDTYALENACSGLINDRTGFGNPLSMTLDYRQVRNVITYPLTTRAEGSRNGKCDRFMVKHPTKAECRTVLCPNGFFRNEEEACVPVSTKWLTSSYYIQLILTPVDTNMLPWSYLTSLTNEQRRSPEAWFNSNIAPLGHFHMYGKRVTINDESYVENILVRIGRKNSPFNVEIETKTIRNAMQKSWTINLKGRMFSFTVKFYRYASFKEDGIFRRYDLISSLSDRLIFEESPSGKMYEDFHIALQEPADIVLKKTHFCERVRLLRSEWVTGFQEIRLNITSGIDGAELVSSDGPVSGALPVSDGGPVSRVGPVSSGGPVSNGGTVSRGGPVSSSRPVSDGGPLSRDGPVSSGVPVSSGGQVSSGRPVSSGGPVSDGGPVLGDSEFDVYTDNLGRPIIEICVEDFNTKYREQGVVKSGAVSATGFGGLVILTIGLTIILK